MTQLPLSLEQLINELSKLPGIGRKTARRLAFSLIFNSDKNARALADSIIRAKKELGSCSICFGLSEGDICQICSNYKRDSAVICVVEDAKNIFTIESSGSFKGVYHVLEGAFSPQNGIGPDELRIYELEERINKSEVKELILATNPTLEGEATAHYLNEVFKEKVELITRIARGMPSGGDLEFADSNTLSRALEGRRSF